MLQLNNITTHPVPFALISIHFQGLCVLQHLHTIPFETLLPLNLEDLILASPSCTEAPLLHMPKAAPLVPQGIEAGKYNLNRIKFSWAKKGSEFDLCLMVEHSCRTAGGPKRAGTNQMFCSWGTHWAEFAEQRTCHGQGSEREASSHLGIAHTFGVKVSDNLSAKGTPGFSTHYLSHLQELI